MRHARIVDKSNKYDSRGGWNGCSHPSQEYLKYKGVEFESTPHIKHVLELREKMDTNLQMWRAKLVNLSIMFYDLRLNPRINVNISWFEKGEIVNCYYKIKYYLHGNIIGELTNAKIRKDIKIFQFPRFIITRSYELRKTAGGCWYEYNRPQSTFHRYHLRLSLRRFPLFQHLRAVSSSFLDDKSILLLIVSCSILYNLRFVRIVGSSAFRNL